MRTSARENSSLYILAGLSFKQSTASQFGQKEPFELFFLFFFFICFLPFISQCNCLKSLEIEVIRSVPIHTYALLGIICVLSQFFFSQSTSIPFQALFVCCPVFFFFSLRCLHQKVATNVLHCYPNRSGLTSTTITQITNTAKERCGHFCLFQKSGHFGLNWLEKVQPAFQRVFEYS